MQTEVHQYIFNLGITIFYNESLIRKVNLWVKLVQKIFLMTVKTENIHNSTF